MKRIILGLAIVGMLSLVAVDRSQAGDGFEHRRAGGPRNARSVQQVGRHGGVVHHGGVVVYGSPAPRHSIHQHVPPHHAHRHHPRTAYRGYVPYHSYVPSYRPSCGYPYSNQGGFGYSSGRVSFWIGF